MHAAQVSAVIIGGMSQPVLALTGFVPHCWSTTQPHIGACALTGTPPKVSRSRGDTARHMPTLFLTRSLLEQAFSLHTHRRVQARHPFRSHADEKKNECGLDNPERAGERETAASLGSSSRESAWGLDWRGTGGKRDGVSGGVGKKAPRGQPCRLFRRGYPGDACVCARVFVRVCVHMLVIMIVNVNVHVH